MRSVLVLLALVVAAWGVFMLLPAKEVEGEEPAAERGPFLTRPEGLGLVPEAPAAAAVEPPKPAAPAQAQSPVSAPEKQKPREEPLSAFGISLSEKGEGYERPLAAALLFGGPADVERALPAGTDEVDSQTRRLYLSFAEAVAGNRRVALELAQGLDDANVLAAEDRELLRAALGGTAPAVARSASARPESAARAAMRLRLVERDAAAALEAGDFAQAAAGWSELLRAAITGPWEPTREALAAWTESLTRAQARHRWDPRGDWPSVEVVVQSGDSLTAIRQRYLQEHPDGLLCTGMIEKANRLVGYLQENQKLRIPTDRPSALVDLSSRWMLYLLGSEVAAAWEVGIGRRDEETITGEFLAADKQERPTWFPSGQEPQYYPNNPLGTRWIAWYRDGQKTGYGFHGTWEEETIGQAASDGCIRLRNADVEVLFAILPAGATIRVQE